MLGWYGRDQSGTYCGNLFVINEMTFGFPILTIRLELRNNNHSGPIPALQRPHGVYACMFMCSLNIMAKVGGSVTPFCYQWGAIDACEDRHSFAKSEKWVLPFQRGARLSNVQRVIAYIITIIRFRLFLISKEFSKTWTVLWTFHGPLPSPPETNR